MSIQGLRLKGNLTFLVMLFYVTRFSAQSSVTGTVHDISGTGVIYANVLILSVTDSSLVKGTVTSEDGSFEIRNVGTGTYTLKVVMVGYKDRDSEPFVLDAGMQNKDFGVLVMEEDAVLMNEVQVVARKPLFEQKIDRMVINVANSITSSGTNVLEVLERSPGVLVNRQNNSISLSGKSGVVVMFNGRINYMTQEALTSLLEGMSSDNIERIEIITNPPASLDAEGNAGYINIVLKKNLDEGLNGSYGFTAGYGKGGTGSANLNTGYRKGKSNLYGDYSYFHESQEQVFSFYRSIMLDGDQIETETRTDRLPNRNNHAARLGWDYQVSPKTIFGLLLSGYNTKWEMDATNHSTIYRNGSPDTLITIENTELNQWKHIGGNINLQHTFSEGKEFSMDLDYLDYLDDNPTYYINAYYNGEGEFLFEDSTRSTKNTPITIKVGKLDYRTPLGKDIKMETGAKITSSSFTNDVGVEYNNGQDWVEAPELTAKYDLLENILAGYVSLEMPLFEKTILKAGLRYEYTDSNLGSEEEDHIVDREFGEWFPSVFLSRSFSENNTLIFSYGKRITRPTFNDMAPFVIFVDPSTFFSGNPALQPSISHNLELNFQHKSALVSLKYSIADSAIANFQSTIIEGTNDQLIFAENLKQLETYSLTFSIPLTPVKWWNMYFNISGVYQEAQKYIEEELYAVESGDFNLFTTQTFTLPEDFTFEVTGYYGSGGLFGIYHIKPYGAVNAGLQKKFGENGGSLRIGFDDIFNTQKFRSDLDLSEQETIFRAQLQFSQPTLKLTYTRNFGNQKMKGARQRSTGSEEERRRVTN